MEPRVDEIAEDIYRISTHVGEIVPPEGFTFNQFLVDAEAPLLFHTGHGELFGAVRDAVARVRDPGELRYISFGHVEADECGSVNEWLAAAPGAEVVFNETGAAVSVRDLADRPPVTLTDGDGLDLGDRTMRLYETPHVPHNWEAQVLFDEHSGTLLCGDLFTQVGDRGALVEDDLVGPALEADDTFDANSLSARTGATLRRLAELEPDTLAVMHGASYRGDGAAVLRELAGAYDDWVRVVLDRGLGAATVSAGCPVL